MKTLKKQNINFNQIRDFLTSAERRLQKAEKILKIDEQSGFQAAYEAMIRASLGYMLSLGTRPRSTVGHHKVIIEYVGSKLGSEYSALVKRFDIMRRKRNKAIYEAFSTISEKEANDAISTAKQFLKIISEHIRSADPQQSIKI
jgi:uncharacterized protein (UPF0332 family)